MNVDFHSVCKLFPLLQGEEFDALVESIKNKGLLNPIWLHPDDESIIDGRNRYRACLKADIEPRFKTWDGKGSLLDFVVGQNIDRRHLDATDKALLAEKLEPMYAAEAKERLRAAQERGRQTQAGKPSSQKIEQSELGKAAERAAKAAKTNRQYVAVAKKLHVSAPQLHAKMERKELTIVQAQREFREQKREERRAENRAIVEKTKTPDVLFEEARFATIVIDPPWDVSDEGDVNQMGRANPDYATMPFAEIKKLPVMKLADKDCHLYLWITNRSLPKGFELIEAWGFRYITTVTWCKPSFGIGNYFRGSTEHILFAVKGSQPLKRRDVGTWFTAPRGSHGHSNKPEAAYSLVESCSPGPYLEMFSRSDRKDWAHWGQNQ